MNQRVTCFSGKTPVLFIAPHGADDFNTAEIAEKAAKHINGFAIINHKWKKNDEVVESKNYGNCNNILHLNTNVLNEEFLKYVFKYVAHAGTRTEIRQRTTHNIDIADYHHFTYGKVPLSIVNKDLEEIEQTRKMFVFIIHGFNKVPSNHDCVIGMGKGNPDSLSCNELFSTMLYTKLKAFNMNPCIAGANHPYSGWLRKNLNQLFVKNHTIAHLYFQQFAFVKLENFVETVQLEFSHDIRTNNSSSAIGERIADAAYQMLNEYLHNDDSLLKIQYGTSVADVIT